MDKTIKIDKNASLSDEDADLLSKRAAQLSIFLKSPERVSQIVEDIATHFNEKVEPHGFKAMIVTPDRFACVQYKEELDKYFPPEASKVVISMPTMSLNSNRNGRSIKRNKIK